MAGEGSKQGGGGGGNGGFQTTGGVGAVLGLVELVTYVFSWKGKMEVWGKVS